MNAVLYVLGGIGFGWATILMYEDSDVRPGWLEIGIAVILWPVVLAIWLFGFLWEGFT